MKKTAAEKKDELDEYVSSKVSVGVQDDMIAVAGAAAIVVPLYDYASDGKGDFLYVPCNPADAMYYQVSGWDMKKQAFTLIGFYEFESDAVLAAVAHHNKVIAKTHSFGHINLRKHANAFRDSDALAVAPSEEVKKSVVSTCQTCGTSFKAKYAGRPAKYCSRLCFERNPARMERKRAFSKVWSEKRKEKWIKDNPEKVAKKIARKEEIARMKAEAAAAALRPPEPKFCIDCANPLPHNPASTKRCAGCNKVHIRAYRKARYEANKGAYQAANMRYAARRAANGGKPLSQTDKGEHQ